MYSFLAKREEMLISETSLDYAEKRLVQIFSDSVSKGEEGLILKAADAKYGETKHPWIKVITQFITDN